mmetsp:Transcript_47534/g.102462  ORF Transcript_47534/g.102462 Transcript_47534/m.102462 type:complete len:532 (+) Transcript_47534:1008-2603(+)
MELTQDARLGHRDGLALHDLVKNRPGTLLHLVELIDAADASVCQNQSSALEGHFASSIVANHRRSKTDTAGTFACGVDGPGSNVADLLDQLTLCHSRIAHEQGMDVTANLHAILHCFCERPDQHQQEGLLHIFMPENFRGDGPGRLFVDVAFLDGLFHLTFQLLTVQGLFVVARLVLLNVVSFNVHGLHTIVPPPSRLLSGLVDASDGDRIPWKDLAAKVACRQDSHSPGNAAHRDVGGHFLDSNLLKLCEFAGPDHLLQSTRGLIVLASLRWALLEGLEAVTLHLHEDFSMAGLTMVSHDFHSRLHWGRSHNHAIELHQSTDGLRLQFSHTDALGRIARLEANVERILQPHRQARLGSSNGFRVSSMLLLDHLLAPPRCNFLCTCREIGIPLDHLLAASVLEMLHGRKHTLLQVGNPLLGSLLQFFLRNTAVSADLVIGLDLLLLRKFFEVVQIDQDGLRGSVGRFLKHGLVLAVSPDRMRWLHSLFEACDEFPGEVREQGAASHGLLAEHQVVAQHCVSRSRSSHLEEN